MQFFEELKDIDPLKTLCEEILQLAKDDYSKARNVYDLIECELFLNSKEFILYCNKLEISPLQKQQEILNCLPDRKFFYDVPIGRIAYLMHYPISDAIEWCVKTNNCKIRRKQFKTVNYKQAKRLVRYIERRENENNKL